MTTEDIALSRIARRVTEGGHDVPEADARRRFRRSIANFPAYAACCDLWQVFDANAAEPKIVAEGNGGSVVLRGDLDRLPRALAAVIDTMP